MPREKGQKLIAGNRKAFHDYNISDRFEAGIVLAGTEVKSLRVGRATLADGYATLDDGEIWLRDVNIAQYMLGTWRNHEPKRKRKLLLHSKEIAKIARLLGPTGGGKTLVPLSMYFKDGYAKVEIGIGTGKHSYDKRQAIAKRDADREAARALATRNKRMQ